MLAGFVLLGSVSGASAASYQRTNGTIVDPIQNTKFAGGGDHAYSGPDLEPYANLSNADLELAFLGYANLEGAELSNANLERANLFSATLSNANLSNANLEGADLHSALLNGANLSNATIRGILDYANLSYTNLSNATLNADMDYANLSYTRLYSADLSNVEWELYEPYYEDAYPYFTGAKYSLNAVDNNGNPIPDTIFPANMDQAWRDAAGMIAVPEPTTALLVGIGLVGLGVRRRVS